MQSKSFDKSVRRTPNALPLFNVSLNFFGHNQKPISLTKSIARPETNMFMIPLFLHSLAMFIMLFDTTSALEPSFIMAISVKNG